MKERKNVKNLQLPFGVQDYLPNECYFRQRTQEKLASVFAAHGFMRVGTPGLEFFDVYDDVLGRAARNKTFKMTDSDGGLLMLRFDPTLQICRMASKLTGERIEKVYYSENSYEYISDPTTARSREFPQAGVELLGSSGTAGDVEAVTVAIECLRAAGLDDFLLEIGQVDYFNGIAGEAGLCERDARELRALINKKDMLGVEMFLRGKNVGEKFRAQFSLLPSLFGDEEVFVRARAGVENEKSLRALDSLGELYAALKAAGLHRYVSMDLGLLRGEYYTGLVLQGFSDRLGLPILDGGRYDALCGAFGRELPAVGFSVGIQRLLMALEKEGKHAGGVRTDCAYISDTDYAFEYEYIGALRAQGNVVEKRFERTEKQLLDYCAARGIPTALVLQNGAAKKIKVGM